MADVRISTHIAKSQNNEFSVDGNIIVKAVNKSFDGEYPIDFDVEKGVYYVDKANRSEISRQYGNHNVPHVNYKSHVNEPYVDIIKNDEIATSITITAAPKARKYSMVVYDGLLELLRVQISDLNKPAVMATLNTIKSLLADE